MTRFYCNISRFVIIFVLFVGGCAAVKKEPSVIRKAALARILSPEFLYQNILCLQMICSMTV
jgi:hypothetical protein